MLLNVEAKNTVLFKDVPHCFPFIANGKKVYVKIGASQSISLLELCYQGFQPDETVTIFRFDKVSPKLESAIATCVKGLLNYDSDTFTTPNYPDEPVTEDEAQRALAVLMHQHLFDESGTPHLDGAEVGFAWDVVLGEEDQDAGSVAA
ncbi:MAG TPA: hypothetical protein V6D07_18645 [Trichocoleus sp.]